MSPLSHATQHREGQLYYLEEYYSPQANGIRDGSAFNDILLFWCAGSSFKLQSLFLAFVVLALNVVMFASVHYVTQRSKPSVNQ